MPHASSACPGRVWACFHALFASIWSIITSSSVNCVPSAGADPEDHIKGAVEILFPQFSHITLHQPTTTFYNNSNMSSTTVVTSASTRPLLKPTITTPAIAHIPKSSQEDLLSFYSDMSFSPPNNPEIEISSTRRSSPISALVVPDAITAPLIYLQPFLLAEHPFPRHGAEILSLFATTACHLSPGGFVRVPGGDLCKLRELENMSKKWVIFRCDSCNEQGFPLRESKGALFAVEVDRVRRTFCGKIKRWWWETKGKFCVA
jgi:hypothetical protein